MHLGVPSSQNGSHDQLLPGGSIDSDSPTAPRRHTYRCGDSETFDGAGVWPDQSRCRLARPFRQRWPGDAEQGCSQPEPGLLNLARHDVSDNGGGWVHRGIGSAGHESSTHGSLSTLSRGESLWSGWWNSRGIARCISASRCSPARVNQRSFCRLAALCPRAKLSTVEIGRAHV